MGISPIQLLIVLAIVVLIFGGKRLRSLGSDLGHAIKGFKEVTKEDKPEDTQPNNHIHHHKKNHPSNIIDIDSKNEHDKTNPPT